MQLKVPEGSTRCQKLLFETFNSGTQFIFVTGNGGVGKSHAIKRLIWQVPKKKRLVVAPTGVAAQLIGGRTIHSAFNINFNLPPDEQVDNAINDDKLIELFEGIDLLVIDEISMVSAALLNVMEAVAREARGSDDPWGGLKVIAMGDFRQLPPVVKRGERRVWAFESDAWKAAKFKSILMQTQMRSQDPFYTEILNNVRIGKLTPEVRQFLDSRVRPGESHNCMHLYCHNTKVNDYNDACLSSLGGRGTTFITHFKPAGAKDGVLKAFPWLGEGLRVKVGARVMIRKNHPDGHYVNGSIGYVTSFNSKYMDIELTNGNDVQLEPAEFNLTDDAGYTYATATNFPISLAYATSIHKSQGSTLDSAFLDIREAWEPGQAYVALSRVKAAEGLFLAGWTPEAIINLDPKVTEFHRQLFHEAVKI